MIPQVTHDTIMTFAAEWSRDKDIPTQLSHQINLRAQFVVAQPTLTAFLAALVSSCKDNMDFTMVASVMWELLKRQYEAMLLERDTKFQ